METVRGQRRSASPGRNRSCQINCSNSFFSTGNILLVNFYFTKVGLTTCINFFIALRTFFLGISDSNCDCQAGEL